MGKAAVGVVAVLIAVVGGSLSPARAAGTVSTPTQAALEAALSGGGTVTIACDGVITLTHTESITATTTIDGTGHHLTLSGGNSVRIFSVSNGVTLGLQNLTLSQGNDGTAGGAISNAGTLNLANCTFSNNVCGGMFSANTLGGGAIYNTGALSATDCAFTGNTEQASPGNNTGPSATLPEDGRGGAIENDRGTLTLVDCTFSGNLDTGGQGLQVGDGAHASDYQTGGNGYGGAIYSSAGSVTLTNCTLASNTAQGGDGAPNQALPPPSTPLGAGGSAYGGALFAAAGTVTLTNSTIAGNTAIAGQGMNFETGQMGSAAGGGLGNGSAALTLRNSILAHNGSNCSGAVGDGGNNIDDDGTAKLTASTDKSKVDPMLAVDASGNPLLADNGGPTPTIALLPGSPAFNAGNDALAPSTDQRHDPRNAQSDIGAYEYWPALTAPTGVNATPGPGSVTIAWTAVTGATAYNVKRAKTSGGPYTTLLPSMTATTTTTTTSFTDTTATIGTPAYYVVSAVNGGGESANSAEVSAAAGRLVTTVSLTASPATAVATAPVLLKAAVTAAGMASGVPSGMVTFQEGAAVLGTAPLDVNGAANITVSNLAVGSHSITATYAGDTTFAGSTSTAVMETVTQDTSATVLTFAPANPVEGQTATLTAMVTGGTPGTGVPTGTVTFMDGSTGLGSGTLDGTGAATLSTTALTAGSHSITAVYGGDTNFSGSTSAPAAVTVSPSVLHTYTGVGWHLVSSPYTISQPFSAITSHVFAFDPASQTYSIPTGTFQIGQGYWIYLTGNSLDIPGPGTAAVNPQPVTIPLGMGWSIVGEPFTAPVPLSQVRVVDAAGNSTALSAATDFNAHLVSPLYTWDLNAMMYNLLNTDTQVFNPWDGAWIYAKQPGLSLVVTPAPGG